VTTVLAIDSVNESSHVALVSGGEVLSARSVETYKTAETLLGMLEGVLNEASVDKTSIEAVAVSTGPGSFTGIRNGISTAQGLALGLGIPVFGVQTLLARTFPHDGLSPIVVGVMKANARESFFAAYRSSDSPSNPFSCVYGPDVAANDEVERIVSEALCEGGNAGVDFKVVHVDSMDAGAPNPAFCVASAVSSEALERGEIVENTVQPTYVKRPAAKTLAERGVLRRGNKN